MREIGAIYCHQLQTPNRCVSKSVEAGGVPLVSLKNNPKNGTHRKRTESSSRPSYCLPTSPLCRRRVPGHRPLWDHQSGEPLLRAQRALVPALTFQSVGFSFGAFLRKGPFSFPSLERPAMFGPFCSMFSALCWFCWACFGPPTKGDRICFSHLWMSEVRMQLEVGLGRLEAVRRIEVQARQAAQPAKIDWGRGSQLEFHSVSGISSQTPGVSPFNLVRFAAYFKAAQFRDKSNKAKAFAFHLLTESSG